jgi:hypothetical protein
MAHEQPPQIPTAPATGSDDYWDTHLAADEEPRVTATLFFVIIILMIIAAFWLTIFMRLLER